MPSAVAAIVKCRDGLLHSNFRGVGSCGLRVRQGSGGDGRGAGEGPRHAGLSRGSRRLTVTSHHGDAGHTSRRSGSGNTRGRHARSPPRHKVGNLKKAARYASPFTPSLRRTPARPRSPSTPDPSIPSNQRAKGIGADPQVTASTLRAAGDPARAPGSPNAALAHAPPPTPRPILASSRAPTPPGNDDERAPGPDICDPDWQRCPASTPGERNPCIPISLHAAGERRGTSLGIKCQQNVNILRGLSAAASDVCFFFFNSK